MEAPIAPSFGLGSDVLAAVIGPPPVARRVAEVMRGAGLAVVACVTRPAQLATVCGGRPPHVVVLPADAALADGASAMRLLASVMPASRAVIVLDELDRAAVRRALRAGAEGFVLEDDLERTLPLVVRGVALGQTSIPRELRRELDDQPLSSREREVLDLVAEGLSNTAIADRLSLAESTVKSHLSSTFSKLGVHRREEAAELARKGGPRTRFEDSFGGQAARLVHGGTA
jgi:two-component system response regulator DevR